MAKKKREESPEEQAKRFEAEVQRLIDADELSPIEADERFGVALDRILGGRSRSKGPLSDA
jgi:hypothetical protein